MSNRFIIEVFYTNIHFSNGGTEKYIKAQMQEFRESGVSTILIFPVKAVNRHFVLWGMQVDDGEITIVSNQKFCSMLKKLIEGEGEVIGLFIHHLLGIALDSLKRIIDILSPAPVYMFIHDFYTVCAQMNFLKDGDKYCGGAENNFACKTCKYGEKSLLNNSKFITFFYSIGLKRLEIVVPSEYVKKEWIKRYKEFEDIVVVQELQKPFGFYVDNSEIIPHHEKIKIAYIGNPVHQKGWDYWKDFINSEYTSGYDIYQFGPFGKQKETNGINNINVSIQRDGEDAMIKALRQYEINAAVLNSVSPETYSYVYHECLAANVFIITNVNSGNIAAKVIRNKNGYVLNSAADLTVFLEDREGLLKRINNYRETMSISPEKLITNRDIVDETIKKDLCAIRDGIEIGNKIDILGFLFSVLYKMKYRSRIRIKYFRKDIADNRR